MQETEIYPYVYERRRLRRASEEDRGERDALEHSSTSRYYGVDWILVHCALPLPPMPAEPRSLSKEAESLARRITLRLGSGTGFAV